MLQPSTTFVDCQYVYTCSSGACTGILTAAVLKCTALCSLCVRAAFILLQRDVPGLTRAAIPVLASRGVLGITGGVNAFSAPPGVPKNTPFVWRDEQSGTKLLAMWHPGRIQCDGCVAVDQNCTGMYCIFELLQRDVPGLTRAAIPVLASKGA
jgi:hypothetical protein